MSSFCGTLHLANYEKFKDAIQYRMAVWKHFIILFGGFYDPGFTSQSPNPPLLSNLAHLRTQARYLNDLWMFDTQEYKWTQMEFKETEQKPSYVDALINPRIT